VEQSEAEDDGEAGEEDEEEDESDDPLGLARVVAQKRKKKKSNRVSVCVTNPNRGSVPAVVKAVEQLGWDLSSRGRDCSVIWLEHSDNALGLAPHQVCSKIEGFVHACKKGQLTRVLNHLKGAFPDEFAFWPLSWVLPQDKEALQQYMSSHKATVIAKPTGGSQGRGLVLAKKWTDLGAILKFACPSTMGVKPQEYVVQRYIPSPMVLDGFKFDCRVYSVVTSVYPLRGYMFDEGLARFCTVPYVAPKASNLSNSKMHLTNYAINKKSEEFEGNTGLAAHDEGSKRSLSAALSQMSEKLGVSAVDLMDRVRQVVMTTLVALQPHLICWSTDRGRPLHPHGPKGFQIIGFDVLFNAKGEPRLLELNANSSLSISQPVVAGDGTRFYEESELDSAIKTQLIAQSLACAAPLRQGKAARHRKSWLAKVGDSAEKPNFSHPIFDDPLFPPLEDNASLCPALELLEEDGGGACLFRDAVLTILAVFRTFSSRGVMNRGQFVKLAFALAPAVFGARTTTELFFARQVQVCYEDEPELACAGFSPGAFLKVVISFARRVWNSDDESEVTCTIQFADQCRAQLGEQLAVH